MYLFNTMEGTERTGKNIQTYTDKKQNSTNAMTINYNPKQQHSINCIFLHYN
eukprot:m.83952 g.83952  ORF g.83952 m.83952 type:complete len:52 (-) comp12139_c0_seq1:1526-1681(-)